MAAEATAVKELPAHWVQAIPPRPKSNPKNQIAAGVLTGIGPLQLVSSAPADLAGMDRKYGMGSFFQAQAQLFSKKILASLLSRRAFPLNSVHANFPPLSRKSMTESATGLKQETTAQMAQRICAEQFAAILIQEAGVRLGNIEAIHDMRVATRRLRVTLINFAACWTKAERQQLKSWLQNLADALGEVRDLDVLMEALKPKLNQAAAGERPLMANLIERLRQQRKRRFQALLVFLDSEAYLRSKDEVPRLLAVPEAAPASPETNG